MGKPLSEMTLRELWELFPIQLVEHRECWDGWYREGTDGAPGVSPRSHPDSSHREYGGVGNLGKANHRHPVGGTVK